MFNNNNNVLFFVIVLLDGMGIENRVEGEGEWQKNLRRVRMLCPVDATQTQTQIFVPTLFPPLEDDW